MAVGENLGESDTFSQIRTTAHADATDIRPHRSLVDCPVELDQRYRTVQQRPSNSVVGNLQVGHQSAFFAIHASADFG